MFNPFRGKTMQKVMDRLIDISKSSKIFICSAGSCSEQNRLDAESELVESGIYESRLEKNC